MNDQYGKGYFDENDHQRGLVLNRGLAGVFGLMFLGLLISAAAAFFTLQTPAMMHFVFNTNASLLFLLAPFGMMLFVFPRVWGMAPGAAFLSFFIFALLMGVSLSSIFLQYDLGTITLAFLSAAGMFGVMAVYGALTKANLSGIGSFLMMGLFGVIIASVLNWFFASTMLDMIISYAGIAIFLGLTAYDVQRLKHQMEFHGGDAPAGVMVMGALHLYLDFINIFLLLLRLLGRRR